ncbi:MAG: KH domain-containing protein [Acidimicrobiales bacterium]
MTDPSLAAEPDLDDLDDDGLDDDGVDGNRVVGALPRAVLEYLARSIVDDPESVVIEAEEGRRALTLRLHVAPGDMGRIIGRRGRVAQAIRTVVRAAGAREGVDAIVDIVD